MMRGARTRCTQLSGLPWASAALVAHWRSPQHAGARPVQRSVALGTTATRAGTAAEAAAADVPRGRVWDALGAAGAALCGLALAASSGHAQGAGRSDPHPAATVVCTASPSKPEDERGCGGGGGARGTGGNGTVDDEGGDEADDEAGGAHVDYDVEAAKLFAELGLQVGSDGVLTRSGSCKDPDGAGGRRARGGAATAHVAYNDLDAVYVHPTTGARVYVGNRTAAKSRETLDQHGITHVVNCQDIRSANFYEGDPSLDYLRCPVAHWAAKSRGRCFGVSESGGRGGTDAATEARMSSLYEFVDGATAAGGSVLIHCMVSACAVWRARTRPHPTPHAMPRPPQQTAA